MLGAMVTDSGYLDCSISMVLLKGNREDAKEIPSRQGGQIWLLIPIILET